MRMYPGYKLQDALNEYATSFFSLLNEGYRLEAADKLLLAQIALLPHLKDSAQREVLRQMQWAAQHPDDILRPSGADDGIESVKQMLGNM